MTRTNPFSALLCSLTVAASLVGEGAPLKESKMKKTSPAVKAFFTKSRHLGYRLTHHSRLVTRRYKSPKSDAAPALQEQTKVLHGAVLGQNINSKYILGCNLAKTRNHLHTSCAVC